MSRRAVDAMLAAGLLLAGAVVAMVLLNFDDLGSIGQTVAIAALALLSGMLIWPALRIGGRTGADDGRASRPVDDASPVWQVAEAPEPTNAVVPAADEVAKGARAESEEEQPPDAPATDARDDQERTGDSDAAVQAATETALEADRNTSIAPVADAAVEPAGGVGEDDSLEPARAAESSASPRVAEPKSGVEHKVEAQAADLQDYRRKLIVGWDRYRVHGDGHFNARGLEEQLNESKIPANVHDGRAVEAEGSVLVVEHLGGNDGRLFVLPSFTKSPRAAPDWFEDVGDGALTRRTRKLHKLAEGKWENSQVAVIEKGRIE